MSRFLGPIHHWLYNKINILEDIEKEILVTLNPSNKEALMTELTQSFGPYLNNRPLEELIDQDNIHGWLQDRIKVAETRLSRMINTLENSFGVSVYEDIASVYAGFGAKYGNALSDGSGKTPEEVFKSLDNYLLEGMPCDRVNAVTESTPDLLKWEKDRCVHAAFWNAGGTDVNHYYKFREAFSKAFVEALDPSFTYKFELKNGLQYHMIFKK